MSDVIAKLLRAFRRSLQAVSAILVGVLVLGLTSECLYRVQRTVREKVSGVQEWQVPSHHPYAGSEWYEKFRHYPSPVYIHDPYRSWQLQPRHLEFMTIDSAGHRGTVQAARRPATRQVWLLGGTVMWGTGARDQHTIPSLVARELLELGHEDIEVVNLAQPYFNFTQESITLLMRLAGGEAPAAAVFLNGLADLRLAREHGRPGHADFEGRNRQLFQAGWYRNTVREDLVDILRHSQLLQRLGWAGALPHSVRAIEQPFTCVDVARYYHKLAVSISGVADGHGFPVLFVRQPDPSDRAEPRPAWERQWPIVDAERSCGQIIDGTMESTGMTHYLSLRGIFDGDGQPRFLKSDGTLTEDANAMVARRIAERLDRALRSGALPRIAAPAE